MSLCLRVTEAVFRRYLHEGDLCMDFLFDIVVEQCHVQRYRHVKNPPPHWICAMPNCDPRSLSKIDTHRFAPQNQPESFSAPEKPHLTAIWRLLFTLGPTRAPGGEREWPSSMKRLRGQTRSFLRIKFSETAVFGRYLREGGLVHGFFI